MRLVYSAAALLSCVREWRSPSFRQGLRPYEFQAFLGVVAMDFLHIELAHEVDGFLGDDCPAP